jgi:hypothetical protein
MDFRIAPPSFRSWGLRTTEGSAGISPTAIVLFRGTRTQNMNEGPAGPFHFDSPEVQNCNSPSSKPDAHFPEKSSERSSEICYHPRVQG